MKNYTHNVHLNIVDCVYVCTSSVTMETNKMGPNLGKSLFPQQGREKELILNREVTNETVKMF